MLCFVGWEAISPLIARLREPGWQLPRIIGAAFVVTALVYLGLAVVTVSVLGARAATGVSLADLLDIAVGGIGRYLAAAAAVALTLAATNAYISGAVELAGRLRGGGATRQAKAAAWSWPPPASGCWCWPPSGSGWSRWTRWWWYRPPCSSPSTRSAPPPRCGSPAAPLGSWPPSPAWSCW